MLDNLGNHNREILKLQTDKIIKYIRALLQHH